MATKSTVRRRTKKSPTRTDAILNVLGVILPFVLNAVNDRFAGKPQLIGIKSDPGIGNASISVAESDGTRSVTKLKVS